MKKVGIRYLKNSKLPRILFCSDISETTLGIKLVKYVIKECKEEVDLREIVLELKPYLVNETTIFASDTKNQRRVLWMLLANNLVSSYGSFLAGLVQENSPKLNQKIILPKSFLKLLFLSSRDLDLAVRHDPWLYIQLCFFLAPVSISQKHRYEIRIGSELYPDLTSSLISLVNSYSFVASPPEELVPSSLSFEEFNRSTERHLKSLRDITSTVREARSSTSWKSAEYLDQRVLVKVPVSYKRKGYLRKIEECMLANRERFFTIEIDDPDMFLFVCPLWILLYGTGRAETLILSFLPLVSLDTAQISGDDSGEIKRLFFERIQQITRNLSVEYFDDVLALQGERGLNDVRVTNFDSVTPETLLADLTVLVTPAMNEAKSRVWLKDALKKWNASQLIELLGKSWTRIVPFRKNSSYIEQSIFFAPRSFDSQTRKVKVFDPVNRWFGWLDEYLDSLSLREAKAILTYTDKEKNVHTCGSDNWIFSKYNSRNMDIRCYLYRMSAAVVTNEEELFTSLILNRVNWRSLMILASDGSCLYPATSVLRRLDVGSEQWRTIMLRTTPTAERLTGYMELAGKFIYPKILSVKRLQEVFSSDSKEFLESELPLQWIQCDDKLYSYEEYLQMVKNDDPITINQLPFWARAANRLFSLAEKR
jgi:hypothetical protein